MADSLKVGVEATLGLDIGMAHKVTHLSFLAADFTLFTHGISSIKKPVWGGMLLKFDTFCIVRTASNSLYLKKRQVETTAPSRPERPRGRNSPVDARHERSELPEFSEY